MTLWFDLKYAWRLLNKSRGHSLMSASVVALSVGLAVWTYALAYSQVWKPLEFRGSERWYSIQLANDAATPLRPYVDAYTYQELLARNPAVHDLGAYTTGTAVLGDGQATTSLRSIVISPRLLAATHVAPLLGRTFSEEDGHRGAAAVAVLSFDTWQNYFAGDRAIVGKTVRIDAAPVQIIGVLAKEFFLFRDHELWQPLQLPRLARPNDSTLTLTPLIMLDEGQSLESVANGMKSAMARVDRDYPALFNPARRVALISAHKMFTHSSTPIVAMLGFMAAAVLLLGCVNISMLFLARLLERSRELALRTALGASQIRLMRQCLLESALVILLGLAAGYGLAALGVRWTEGISSFLAQILAAGRGGNLPALRSMDFVAAIIAAAAIWLLSTLVPAWRIGKRDAAAVLAGSGKGDGARGSNRSVAFLVGLQVVISCLVLVMCGSLVLAVNGEVNQPTGLNTANVMMSVAPTTFGARHAEASQRLRYWDNLTAAITKRIPGAEVAFTTAAPTRPNRVPASIDSEQDRQKQATLTLPLAVVSENYFRLLDVHLRSGRLFDSTDNQASLNVTVVDEQLAARYWPDGKVLGKRIHLNSADGGQWLTIVGIVSSVTGRPYRDEEIGVAYQPLRQAVPEEFQVLVRLPNAANGSRAALRAAAFEADRDLALQNLQMVDDYIAALKLSWTAMVPVVTVVAIITAILAASGLFGLITRSVAQRTHEVGIRRALGATAWRSTSMFRRQGALYLSISVVGIGGGVVATTLLSSTITNILEHVFPATVGVVLLTALVIFTASYLPTRRAVALEPGDALHYE